MGSYGVWVVDMNRDPCGKPVTRRDCGVDGGGTEAMVDRWHMGRGTLEAGRGGRRQSLFIACLQIDISSLNRDMA